MAQFSDSAPATQPTVPAASDLAMAALPGDVRSRLDQVVWPALPGGAERAQLSIMFQLEQSQWWSPARILEHQLRQLACLVRHAAGTTQYYRALFERIGFDPNEPLSIENWQRLPILDRRAVQEHNAALRSQSLPKGHGAIGEVTTSGSTGTPVTVAKTALQQLFWQAATLREHLWHRRDLSKRLAVIRNPSAPGQALYPEGTSARGWGSSTRLMATGPSYMLSLSTPVEQQVEWLRRIAPDYLLTFPTNLQALAHHCLDKGEPLQSLRELRSVSEPLRPEIRDICRRAFGAAIKDVYSAEEVGCIAFQSPDSEQLLVQAEIALVEIVDDRGRACGPGEVGQVLVTPLHGFAMPLLRYAIGDYAEVGGTAACGRGLPVIDRVMGRLRDLVELPDGRRFIPNYIHLMQGMENVVQFQIARTAVDSLEVRLVAREPLATAQESALAGRIRERFFYPFVVTFVYLHEIPRTRSGKFLDYVSTFDRDT